MVFPGDFGPKSSSSILNQEVFNRTKGITPPDDGLRPTGGQSTRQLEQQAPKQKDIQVEPTPDRRVRIRPKSNKAWEKVFGLPSRSTLATGGPPDDGFRPLTQHILAPLHPDFGETDGLVFPYTPTVNYAYTAEWNAYDLTHTNYQNQAFNRSYPDLITVVGQFSAQSEREAKYALAAIHFFRTATKMFYGRREISSGSNLAGTPPPTLLFSGHGNGMFNDIPVVITNFVHELLNDADYVRVPYQGGEGEAWVPALFTISVSMAVQQDLKRVRDEFKLSEFASGKQLLKKGLL